MIIDSLTVLLLRGNNISVLLPHLLEWRFRKCASVACIDTLTSSSSASSRANALKPAVSPIVQRWCNISLMLIRSKGRNCRICFSNVCASKKKKVCRAMQATGIAIYTLKTPALWCLNKINLLCMYTSFSMRCICITHKHIQYHTMYWCVPLHSSTKIVEVYRARWFICGWLGYIHPHETVRHTERDKERERDRER